MGTGMGAERQRIAGPAPSLRQVIVTATKSGLHTSHALFVLIVCHLHCLSPRTGLHRYTQIYYLHGSNFHLHIL